MMNDTYVTRLKPLLIAEKPIGQIIRVAAAAAGGLLAMNSPAMSCSGPWFFFLCSAILQRYQRYRLVSQRYRVAFVATLCLLPVYSLYGLEGLCFLETRRAASRWLREATKDFCRVLRCH